MPLLKVLALMALPFLEVWLMIAIGGWIGVPWTLAAIVSLMILGIAVLRRAGSKAYQDADRVMRTGEKPSGGLLDPLMLMAGGILLVIPGFITALLGALLVLPFTRPLLRWAFVGWAERRMNKMRERMENEYLAQGITVPNQGAGSPFGQQHGGDPFGRTPGGAQQTGSEDSGRGRVIRGQFEPVDPDDDQQR